VTKWKPAELAPSLSCCTKSEKSEKYSSTRTEEQGRNETSKKNRIVMTYAKEAMKAERQKQKAENQSEKAENRSKKAENQSEKAESQ
jgi:hypothetical protein